MARILLATALAALLAAIGTTGYRSLRDRRLRGRVQSTYVEASCTVLSSNVTASAHSGRAHGRDRHRDSHPVYEPAIRYSYQVDGHRFESTRYALVPRTEHDRAVTERLVQRYTPGTDHPCWYDPDAPAEAVLTRE